MSAIFSAFGIDWRSLLIDSANFALLLGLLWYFLYAPLTRMLEERRRVVAQGVYDAERAAEELRTIEASRERLLSEAGREADDVLARARAGALVKERERAAAAEAAAGRILAEAQAAAAEEKVRAMTEAKQEVAKLVVLGMEQAMGGK